MERYRPVIGRTALRVAGILLLSALAGCGVVGDLISPALLTNLGVDASLVGQPGRLVVAFSNRTTSSATFQVASIAGSGTTGAKQSALNVPANAVAGISLDCPIAQVAPGTLAEEGIVGADAVIVAGNAVDYAGAVLQASVDYNCGDVIEVQLIQGTGDTDFSVLVRVIPGR